MKIILQSAQIEVEAKKSRFLGIISPVKSESEARDFLSAVRKKYFDARHHAYAMRIGDENSLTERSSDDGEPQGTAGKPILETLRTAGLTDICLVVTRYFGGTLLGTGGLERAYREAARMAVLGAGMYELRRGFLMEVHCSYKTIGLLKRKTFSMGLTPFEEEYAADPRLSFIVPGEQRAAFETLVGDVTLGHGEARAAKEIYFYGDSIPKIYKILKECDQPCSISRKKSAK